MENILDNKNLEEQVKCNELKLLEKDTRKNKNELEKLISKDFIEYGSSGLIYSYDETINGLLNETEEKIYKIIKMETKIISNNIVMVLYIIDINGNISNRSSIWKKENNEWKIIFHQGTKANKKDL